MCCITRTFRRKAFVGKKILVFMRDFSVRKMRKPFLKKILVANRSEIACRIIRAARKMGIKTVAVYSDADASALHVKQAHEKVYIGKSHASDSYLNVDRIIEAVKQTGAEAVHPGYGFLSESPKFVKTLENECISFIGPSSGVIFKMGDKLESKKAAKSAGVSTIPGYEGIVTDAEECAKIAREIGYPVMIKASGGGGGKGMRIAFSEEDVMEGFKLSTQEAVSSFGDSRMLVEKYILNPRHIEIQILCDKYGNALYLNERECSIQRRNQKVIEEAPSKFLDPSTRNKMGQQAVQLCQSIGYSSAGTVEFLVDENKNFYFLEMNTRLQVEHPITELITGIDLVEMMIKIAAGEKLSIDQNDIKINGWAIESRVYAEDPYKQFGLPSIGKLYKYIEPTFMPGVRCDSGIEEGSEISIYYDPLICKLITWGKDREDAIKKNVDALDNYVIKGVKHNIPMLRDVLTNQKFIEGDISTNFLAEVYPNGFHGKILSRNEKLKLVAIGSCLFSNNEIRASDFFNEHSTRMDNLNKWNLVISLNSESYQTSVSLVNDGFLVRVDGETLKVGNHFRADRDILKVKVDGQIFSIQLLSKSLSGDFEIVFLGSTYKFNVMTRLCWEFLRLMPKEQKVDFSKIVRAPMPGLVVGISCRVGQCVQEGSELCVIEAMKMQNSMTATVSGIIKSIAVKAGDTVCVNEVLIVIE